jgi:hypothetical protein
MAKIVSTEQAGPGTTGAVDTTGATLLVATVFGQIGDPVISDSKSNTWTALTAVTGGGNECRLYYVEDPTVGSGHTFTLSGSFAAMCIAAHSGVIAVSPFDQQNGTAEGASPRSTGSVTPSEDNELIIVGGGGSGAGHTIDNGVTLDEQIDLTGGVNYGCAIGHKYQVAAAAINPAISTTSGTTAAVIATFKTAAAGGSMLQLIKNKHGNRMVLNGGRH